MKNKVTYYFFLFFNLLFTTNLFAFACYFSLAKDSCWLNYDLQVDVFDASNNNKIITLNIPRGKTWVREQFSCDAKQKFFYLARFQPVFWKTEEGKTYHSINLWSLPDNIIAKQKAWNINVCFAGDFAAVPLPPEASGSCKCDFSVFPKFEFEA